MLFCDVYKKYGNNIIFFVVCAYVITLVTTYQNFECKANVKFELICKKASLSTEIIEQYQTESKSLYQIQMKFIGSMSILHDILIGHSCIFIFISSIWATCSSWFMSIQSIMIFEYFITFFTFISITFIACPCWNNVIWIDICIFNIKPILTMITTNLLNLRFIVFIYILFNLFDSLIMDVLLTCFILIVFFIDIHFLFITSFMIWWVV